MAYRLFLTLVLLALGGCAAQATLPAHCATAAVAADVAAEVSGNPACDSSAERLERAAAVGSVSQSGSQTRTVGVPREFLVALLVLILLLGLA